MQGGRVVKYIRAIRSERVHVRYWPLSVLLDRAPRTGIATFRALSRLHPRLSDADPFKVDWVDPDRIEYALDGSVPVPWGLVQGGNWDRDAAPFSERPVYQGLESYIDTGDEDRLRSVFSEGRGTSGRPRYSDGDVDDRVVEVKRLVDTLREEGYRSQTELLAENPARHRNALTDAVPASLNEITVDVGRDGTLLWRTFGQHRLAIARLVGLDEVAIQFARRHAAWQQVRDAFRRADTLSDVSEGYGQYVDHPDLQDVQPDR